MSELKKYHRPYTYLTQQPSDGSYHLFVAIAVRTGYRLIVPVEPVYTNGTSLIRFALKPDTRAVRPRENYYFALNPEQHPQINFNPDSDEIRVVITVFTDTNTVDEVHQTTLLYRDCDREACDAMAIAHQIAYNCPYTYLTEVENGTAGEVRKFDPALLIYRKGFKKVAERPTFTNPINGIFEYLVILSNDNPGVDRARFDSTFEVNSPDLHYYNSGILDGNFTVTVILEENVPRSDSYRRLGPAEIFRDIGRNGQEPGIPTGAGRSAAELPAEKAATDPTPKRRRKTSKTRNIGSKSVQPAPQDRGRAER